MAYQKPRLTLINTERMQVQEPWKLFLYQGLSIIPGGRVDSNYVPPAVQVVSQNQTNYRFGFASESLDNKL
jgi:hypothetical protein